MNTGRVARIFASGHRVVQRSADSETAAFELADDVRAEWDSFSDSERARVRAFTRASSFALPSPHPAAFSDLCDWLDIEPPPQLMGLERLLPPDLAYQLKDAVLTELCSHPDEAKQSKFAVRVAGLCRETITDPILAAQQLARAVRQLDQALLTSPHTTRRRRVLSETLSLTATLARTSNHGKARRVLAAASDWIALVVGRPRRHDLCEDQARDVLDDLLGPGFR